MNSRHCSLVLCPPKNGMGREFVRHPTAAIHSNPDHRTTATATGLSPLDGNIGIREAASDGVKLGIMSTATARSAPRVAQHPQSPAGVPSPNGAARRPRTMSEGLASGNVSVGDMVAKAKKAAVSLWLILHAQVRFSLLFRLVPAGSGSLGEGEFRSR